LSTRRALGESRVPPEQERLSLAATSVRDDSTLTAFRFSTYDVPFWTRNNTRAARWNYANDGCTQYWALCPEASWAELIRYENLTTEEELDQVRMPLWVCRIPELGLLDLRDAENQRRCDLTAEELVADAWTATQRSSTKLREEVPGILTPSSALPGHTNVTLFGPRRSVDWHTRPALASTLPTTRVAIGRPPPDLVGLVRRPGPEHQSQLFQ
jgi:hypothetical protein